MGVLGLTPFLQKICPNVIRKIPQRLLHFHGKTIAIDATLLTQRLHFAPHPHPYRHVLGWYKLAKDLREHGVSAVCVFDGKERNAAKAQETQRRREIRKRDGAREEIEKQRLQRLESVGGALQQFAALEGRERQDISAALLTIHAEETLSVQNSHDTSIDWDATLVGPDVDLSAYIQEQDWDCVDGSQDLLWTSGFNEETIFKESTLAHKAGSLTSCDSQHNATVVSKSAEIPFNFSSADDEKTPSESTDIYPETNDIDSQPVLPQSISATLTALYRDYLKSIPELISLPPDTSSEDQESHVEYLMSKRQVQLAQEEGKFWQSFSEEGTFIRGVDSAEDVSQSREEALSLLTRQSRVVSESYARRNNPPSKQTYNESKEILTAMGIPCLDTSGAIEAEALASSLVLNGYADFVASEDTDVIVYEAPLLRNLASRVGPLFTIRGTEIRNELNLSREEFIDFALLLGTDFSQRIKNVGPQRALKFLRAHGTIENIVVAETKYPPRVSPEKYLETVGVARQVFRTLPPIPMDYKSLVANAHKDDVAVKNVMRKCGFFKEISNEEWVDALGGNFFGDDPKAW